MSIATFVFKILLCTIVCLFFVRHTEKASILLQFLNGTTKFVETTRKKTFSESPILVFCSGNRMKNASKILDTLSSLIDFNGNNAEKVDECILGTEIRMLCGERHGRWEECPLPTFCKICDFWPIPPVTNGNDSRYNSRILLQNLHHQRNSKNDGFYIRAVDQYSTIQILSLLKPKVPYFAFNFQYEITLHLKIVKNLNCGGRKLKLAHCQTECLKEKMSEICDLQNEQILSKMDKYKKWSILQCLEREFSSEENALYTKFCSICGRNCKQISYLSTVEGKLKFPTKNFEKNFIIGNLTNSTNFLMININFDDRLTVVTEIFVVNFLDAAVALGYVCFGLVMCYFVLIAKC